MKLILATHAFLWFIGDDAHLSASARALIEDGSNEAYLLGCLPTPSSRSTTATSTSARLGAT